MDISTLALDLGAGPAPSYERFVERDQNNLSGITKYRVIHKPNASLRLVHERLKEYLSEIAPELPYATGCRPGCSPQENVKRHRYNRYFYITDLHKAYWNVDVERLATMFESFDPELEDEHEKLVEFLTNYCMAGEEGLMTGAPTSPEIFNCYAGVLLDYAIGNYCEYHGMTYSRYLDDLTVSSPDGQPIGRHKRKKIRWMIEAVGFSVSHRKTQVLDLAVAPIRINGIGLEYGGRIFLSRRYLKTTNALIRQALAGEAISRETIAGRMGTFWCATDREATLTRREKEVVGNYQVYKYNAKHGYLPKR